QIDERALGLSTAVLSTSLQKLGRGACVSLVRTRARRLRMRNVLAYVLFLRFELEDLFEESDLLVRLPSDRVHVCRSAQGRLVAGRDVEGAPLRGDRLRAVAERDIRLRSGGMGTDAVRVRIEESFDHARGERGVTAGEGEIDSPFEHSTVVVTQRRVA